MIGMWESEEKGKLLKKKQERYKAYLFINEENFCIKYMLS